MTFFRCVVTLLLVLIPVSGWSLDIHYRLAIKIDPAQRTLSGTGVIGSPGPAEFQLSVAGLQGVRVNNRAAAPDGRQQITIRTAAAEQIRIDFKAALNNNGQVFIDRENVFLTGLWYPRPAGPGVSHT